MPLITTVYLMGFRLRVSVLMLTHALGFELQRSGSMVLLP